MSVSKIVFLAGIPSVGKSTFADWAHENRGVAHIDAERKMWAQDVAVFREPWDQGDVPAFVKALRDDGRTFIFTWGFPTTCISAVEAFRDAGAALWWLSGDLSAARRAHERAGKNLVNFDLQVQSIGASKGALDRLFPRELQLNALDAAGKNTPGEQLYAATFG
jgi:hypothetical protein